MSLAELQRVQEALKNLSGDELARLQHTVLTAPDADDEARASAMSIIGGETEIRQTEGFGRKTERFLNRHGERVALVGLGALFG